MGFAGLQLVERGFLGLGLQAALVDLLGRDHALDVGAGNALGLVLCLLGGGRLLGDLGAQQGIVELDQRLALLHPGALLHIDLGDPVAGQVGAHGRFFARDQKTRGREPALHLARQDLDHVGGARLLGIGLRRLRMASAGRDGCRHHRQGQGDARDMRCRFPRSHLTPSASPTPRSALAA